MYFYLQIYVESACKKHAEAGEARKNGTLERLRIDLNNQDLLILDEWGYVPVDRDGSELLNYIRKLRKKESDFDIKPRILQVG